MFSISIFDGCNIREYKWSCHGWLKIHPRLWTPSWLIMCSRGPTILWKQQCVRIWRNLRNISRTMVFFLDSKNSYRSNFQVKFILSSYLYFTVDKYSWLVDGTAESRVVLFIDEEHTFEEYTEVTNMLNALWRVIYAFSVDCTCVLTIVFFFSSKWRSFRLCRRRFSASQQKPISQWSIWTVKS